MEASSGARSCAGSWAPSSAASVKNGNTQLATGLDRRAEALYDFLVDKIKTRLVFDEAGLLLDVPIQIELEYELDGAGIDASSASKKIYFDRPALLKECPGRSADELDRLVNQAVWRAIEAHYSTRHYS